jgi:anion-transporting  ArsA/GET3 family ATPase
MAQVLPTLASRKLLVVTGKGGAGKSLLSLALAHRLSCLGKRVWLVELGRKRDREFTRLPELVGRAKIGHEPVEVTLPGTKQKILVSVLDPILSLSEYVDLKLPTGGLAGILLNNRVTSSFLEVVPGLPDLVQLGKLWYCLVNPRENGPDLVVLDAPATGHAVSLLKAPDNFRRITRMGPIYRDADQMARFLADPAQTSLVFTSLPEEMSVQETLELQKLLAKDFPPPLIYVNKCFPVLPAQKEKIHDPLLAKAYRYSRNRAEREQACAAGLKKARQLPFLFPDPGSPALFLRLSELLE